MAIIIDIADAVVQLLNQASFSQTVAAERRYQPIFDLSEMTDLHVSVVPRGVIRKSLDRARDSFEYQIDIAVQQKTDMSQAALDGLMTLVEEIADCVRKQALTAYPDAHCTEIKNDPVYAADHLEEFRAFTSVLTAIYRVWR
ncbi:MAG: hypothetical protein KatS3mg082_2724 [Nitrospiraceae bacterium]|nr:MAG: hypothetical protein KatS3mg082_2724 [Nitrospiraceae bacterium]GIW81327.1 MAG: hypothetical protein KatS3mg105_3134 [Gemmatales bacterium]